jgi:hypothetical protein
VLFETKKPLPFLWPSNISRFIKQSGDPGVLNLPVYLLAPGCTIFPVLHYTEKLPPNRVEFTGNKRLS